MELTMSNLFKIFAALSLAATFSFAQYDVQYDENGNSEEQPEQSISEPEESENFNEEKSEETVAPKKSKKTAKKEAKKLDDDDPVMKVLAEKRARDAARKEEERQQAIREKEEQAANAESQKNQKSKVGIGIRADFDIANYWGTKYLDDEGFEEPSGFGFTAGITARASLLSVLDLVPEVTFEALWANREEDNFDREFTQYNLNIAVYFRALLHPRFYAEVGPQISFNLSNDVTSEDEEVSVDGLDVSMENPFNEEIEQAPLAFGVALGLGFNIIPQLSIGVRVYAGFTELYPDAKVNNDDASERVIGDDEYIGPDMTGTKLFNVKIGLNYWFM